MVHYRVFEVNSEGRILAPAKVIEALDHEHAIETAKQMNLGKLVEIWEGDRRVAEIK